MKNLLPFITTFIASQSIFTVATESTAKGLRGRHLVDEDNSCPCFNLQDLIGEFGRPGVELEGCSVNRKGINNQIQGGSVVVDFQSSNRACAGTQCRGRGTCQFNDLVRPVEINDPTQTIPFEQESDCVSIIEDFCENHLYTPPSTILDSTAAVTIRSNRFLPFSNLYLTSPSCASASDVTVENHIPSNHGDQTKQQWLLHDDGSIESVHCPGMVLDVRGNNCNLEDLILYPSHGGQNQEWRLSEPLHDATPSYGGSLHGVSSFRCPSHSIAADNESAESYVNLDRLSYTWRIRNV